MFWHKHSFLIWEKVGCENEKIFYDFWFDFFGILFIFGNSVGTNYY